MCGRVLVRLFAVNERAGDEGPANSKPSWRKLGHDYTTPPHAPPSQQPEIWSAPRDVPDWISGLACGSNPAGRERSDLQGFFSIGVLGPARRASFQRRVPLAASGYICEGTSGTSMCQLAPAGFPLTKHNAFTTVHYTTPQQFALASRTSPPHCLCLITAAEPLPRRSSGATAVLSTSMSVLPPCIMRRRGEKKLAFLCLV